ncbi:protein tyrosine phosphatase [Stieleria sp. JC731]|uniref:low molecular weight protein tyrosine phosphatase family protein n=1 Tax=Pirellulaceae TaxID=2691357 RepID=UPI001E5858A6|nr:protein tyrosine phosphatase [Stieleria sp. JC731]MCC9600994.1 protein tyrosine phosphatase [Stieleria sp. JC731]
MANRINVLFVCSKNQWRSPTAEAVYLDDPRVSVRSRGTAKSARQTLQDIDLAWADLVLVMEDKHRHRLLADYPGETGFLPIEVLHIPDDYQFMDPELVELIRVASEPIIDSFKSKPSRGL